MKEVRDEKRGQRKTVCTKQTKNKQVFTVTHIEVLILTTDRHVGATCGTCLVSIKVKKIQCKKFQKLQVKNSKWKKKKKSKSKKIKVKIFSLNFQN